MNVQLAKETIEEIEREGRVERRLSCGVLGATGMVGRELLRGLVDHPWFRVDAIAASAASRGASLGDRLAAGAAVTELDDALLGLSLQTPDELLEAPPELVFSALPTTFAETIESRLAERGCHVFSNAAAHRHASDVPLLVPEVNAPHLELLEHQRRVRGWRGSIVTNPNCSTVGLTLGLDPWLRELPIESVHVTTYQALSGAGRGGVSALDIAGNVLPFIPFEEDKIERESRKILGTWNGSALAGWSVPVYASCARVAVADGHLLALHVELQRDVPERELCDAITAYRGCPEAAGLPSSPALPVELLARSDAPQPARDLHPMTVRVGRVRATGRVAKAFLLSHNLIRGSAGGALLNAELAFSQGALT